MPRSSGGKAKAGKKEQELSAEDLAYGGCKGAYQGFRTEAIKRAAADAEGAANAEVQIEEEKQRRLRDLLGNTTSYRLAEYEKQKQALRDALQIGEIDTSQFEEAMAKIDESITKLTEDGKDKFKDLERAIDGWGKNSAKALADFVTEGKRRSAISRARSSTTCCRWRSTRTSPARCSRAWAARAVSSDIGSASASAAVAPPAARSCPASITWSARTVPRCWCPACPAR